MTHASPSDRKEEMVRFLHACPDADTTAVVDFMMDQFPGSERHQHRAMLQRVQKSLKTYDIAELELTINGQPITGFGEDMGLDFDPVPEYTRKQRARLVELVFAQPADGELDEDGVIDALHGTDMSASRAASLAMLRNIQYACRASDRKGTFAVDEINARFAKVDRAECPVCHLVVFGEDDINKHFGYRVNYTRRQSNCRACRKEHAKAQRAKAQEGTDAPPGT